MARSLRSGYTTGACAAAAAKAAVILLIEGSCPKAVEIPFPDDSRHRFMVHGGICEGNNLCRASIIKDAGDDPDVTNGAEIVAIVENMIGRPDTCQGISLDCPGQRGLIMLEGGQGVGRVTRPGLAVKVGEPAINPGPRWMIGRAVAEGLAGTSVQTLQVVVSITKGEELAGRTLNRRLGILGGLSVLGSTGIVRPVSAEAWTATIEASLDVAREAGITEVMLSTGRRSEKGVQTLLAISEEACAMMGDYLEFSLKAASIRGFAKIHLAGMWAKVMKAALEIPQTHVRNGSLEVRDGVGLLSGLGADNQLRGVLYGANTAREIYEHLRVAERYDLIQAVCLGAKAYAATVSGLPVSVYLVDGNGRVVAHV